MATAVRRADPYAYSVAGAAEEMSRRSPNRRVNTVGQTGGAWGSANSSFAHGAVRSYEDFAAGAIASNDELYYGRQHEPYHAARLSAEPRRSAGVAESPTRVQRAALESGEGRLEIVSDGEGGAFSSRGSTPMRPHRSPHRSHNISAVVESITVSDVHSRPQMVGRPPTSPRRVTTPTRASEHHRQSQPSHNSAVRDDSSVRVRVRERADTALVFSPPSEATRRNGGTSHRHEQRQNTSSVRQTIGSSGGGNVRYTSPMKERRSQLADPHRFSERALEAADSDAFPVDFSSQGYSGVADVAYMQGSRGLSSGAGLASPPARQQPHAITYSAGRNASATSVFSPSPAPVAGGDGRVPIAVSSSVAQLREAASPHYQTGAVLPPPTLYGSASPSGLGAQRASVGARSVKSTSHPSNSQPQRSSAAVSRGPPTLSSASVHLPTDTHTKTYSRSRSPLSPPALDGRDERQRLSAERRRRADSGGADRFSHSARPLSPRPRGATHFGEGDGGGASVFAAHPQRAAEEVRDLNALVEQLQMALTTERAEAEGLRARMGALEEAQTQQRWQQQEREHEEQRHAISGSRSHSYQPDVAESAAEPLLELVDPREKGGKAKGRRQTKASTAVAAPAEASSSSVTSPGRPPTVVSPPKSRPTSRGQSLAGSVSATLSPAEVPMNPAPATAQWASSGSNPNLNPNAADKDALIAQQAETIHELRREREALAAAADEARRRLRDAEESSIRNFQNGSQWRQRYEEAVGKLANLKVELAEHMGAFDRLGVSYPLTDEMLRSVKIRHRIEALLRDGEGVV